MSKPKMMLFSPTCGSSFITGAERYSLMLAIEAGDQFDCTLVAPEGGILLSEASRRGIRTLIQDIPLVGSMRDPGADLPGHMERKMKQYEHGEIVNLLHIHQPDVVVVHGCVNPMPALAAKALGIPVVWCITETIAQHGHTKHSVDWIHQHSDWIVGMSDASLRPFRKSGIDKKLCLIPPTWHMEQLSPEAWPHLRHGKRMELQLEEGSRVIGYISSSLRPEKGIDHFVQMAIAICESTADVRFVIVGSSSDSYYATHCQPLIHRSGHASRFHRVPFEARLEHIYPALDLVVVPSLVDEGFGMTALEGLVFGKGVIAYRSGGLEEILRSTGNADWLVDKGDTGQLIHKVQQWLHNDHHRLKAGSSHLHSADAVFGLGSHRSRLHKLLVTLKDRLAETASDKKKSMLPPLLMNAVYKGKAASTVFLLENGVKRPFASQAAFYFFKYRWSDVNTVTDAVLHRFPTGAPISMEPPFHKHRPSIMMAKGRGPAVYLLVGGVRCPFSSLAAMRQRGLDPDRIVRIAEEELRLLTIGEPLRPLRPVKRKLRRCKSKKLRRGRLGCRARAAAGRRKRCGCRHGRLPRRKSRGISGCGSKHLKPGRKFKGSGRKVRKRGKAA